MTHRIDLPVITTPETYYVKLSLRILNTLLGVRAERQNTGAIAVAGRFIRFGKKGNLDIAGSINGTVFELEIKRPDHRTLSGKIVRPRPTAEQYERMNRINREGGYAWWTCEPSLLTELSIQICSGLKPFIDTDGNTAWSSDRNYFPWWEPKITTRAKKAKVKR